jgi:hypothetical protein
VKREEAVYKPRGFLNKSIERCTCRKNVDKHIKTVYKIQWGGRRVKEGKMKIWKYSGIFLIITGIIHNIVAILSLHEPYRQIIKNGFINTVTITGDVGRLFAFWFFMCGMFIIFLGQVLHYYIRREQQPAPFFFGASILVLSVFICIVEPVSGSWLFIPQALIIIFAKRKNGLIEKFDTAPEGSNILKDFGPVNYCDSYRIQKSAGEDMEEITGQIFRLPKWVHGLMKARHLMVRPFGLKTDKEVKTDKFFPVIEKNEHEVIMGINDAHLNFRTSVFADRKESYIYLTTIVQYNKFLGKAYFFFVKPFHRLIVYDVMKKYLKGK